jgi:hypothetical protein
VIAAKRAAAVLPEVSVEIGASAQFANPVLVIGRRLDVGGGRPAIARGGRTAVVVRISVGGVAGYVRVTGLVVA